MNPDDNLPLMTWHARPDLSCEYVNRAWLDYTGYTLEQALGEGWSRCLHPEDFERWLQACVRAFDERKPFDIEYRLLRRGGEYRWVLDRAAPRFSGEGLFLGYAGGCVDIDEHKRTELGLSRALERERRLRVAFEETNRVQSRLIANLLGLAQPAGAQTSRRHESCSVFSTFPKETRMNWDRIQGNWKQMKGKLKEKWGKLTDDEFDQVAGNRDQLVGKIQERYGIARDEAERQVKDWESRT
jgi:PAS domain S-box-containing protein